MIRRLRVRALRAAEHALWWLSGAIGRRAAALTVRARRLERGLRYPARPQPVPRAALRLVERGQ